MLDPQVKAGTIFDNILVCDDPAYAKAQAEKIIVPFQKAESEMKVTPLPSEPIGVLASCEKRGMPYVVGMWTLPLLLCVVVVAFGHVKVLHSVECQALVTVDHKSLYAKGSWESDH